MKDGHFPKETIRRCNNAEAKLTEELGRDPLPEEIAAETGINLWDVRDMMGLKIEDETPQKDEFQLRFKMTIKNHELEKARVAKGWLQKEVAEKVGISMMTYTSIECCRKYPDKLLQNAIADALGVASEILFPEWLQMYSKRWNAADKSRIVPVNMLSIGSSAVLALPSGDYDEMERQAQNAIFGNVLGESMKNLTEREKEVLTFRYVEDHTLEETGRAFGVTRERIHQIEANALEKLREDPTIKILDL